MIVCIFGLTACGSGEAVSEIEQMKLEQARQMAVNYVNIFNDLCLNPSSLPEELSDDDVEYVLEQSGLLVDGYAVSSARKSFGSALESMGSIIEVGEAKAKADGNQIIVEVQVTGTEKNAVAEVVFSNDYITMRLESASLNPVSSMGQLMGRAALNTVIGMGTVFAVLILISFVISCFRFISKAQDAAAKRKKEKAGGGESEDTGVDNAVAQIAAQEATDGADPSELIAVIAAAIAASQGAASTDGFVVRSVIRRR